MNFSNRPYAMYPPKIALSRPWTLIALTLALVLPLLAGGQAYANGKATHSEDVPVVNYTTFNDASLSSYLGRMLSPELRQVIRERKLTVVATTTTFEKVGACYAEIGLSEAAPSGRNPRAPKFDSRGFMTQTIQDVNGIACAESVLNAAVNGLNKTTIAQVLGGIEATASGGGLRKSGQAFDPKTAQLSRYPLEEYELAPLFEELHNFRIGEAVDYRHVEVAVWSRSTRLTNGSLMCVARAGFTARSPEDRHSRTPSFIKNHVYLPEDGSLADCEQQAAIGAIQSLMKDPWVGEGGSMTNIARTREDGIPLPDLKRVAAVENQLVAETQARQRVVASRNTQANRVSCTNQCSNGACLRTFSDGRQERWQAPRVYNSFKQDWEWNTSSCGG